VVGYHADRLIPGVCGSWLGYRTLRRRDHLGDPASVSRQVRHEEISWWPSWARCHVLAFKVARERTGHGGPRWHPGGCGTADGQVQARISGGIPPSTLCPQLKARAGRAALVPGRELLTGAESDPVEGMAERTDQAAVVHAATFSLLRPPPWGA